MAGLALDVRVLAALASLALTAGLVGQQRYHAQFVVSVDQRFVS